MQNTETSTRITNLHLTGRLDMRTAFPRRREAIVRAQRRHSWSYYVARTRSGTIARSTRPSINMQAGSTRHDHCFYTNNGQNGGVFVISRLAYVRARAHLSDCWLVRGPALLNCGKFDCALLELNSGLRKVPTELARQKKNVICILLFLKYIKLQTMLWKPFERLFSNWEIARQLKPRILKQDDMYQRWRQRDQTFRTPLQNHL